ncbi:RNA polymerase subunit sigma [Micromonospora craterilacus]|uniref:RNA polymerase subunit sigma n=1 Tax=Micromonospora craterilacus TaxID=1655439 RepID=A0A2W2FHY1_9ACTN|nr:sigma-70 family RNA polymerase sigma factor [Micromonospora craterilacus]PZG14874.1 RNA polymerase subunit sigma [Micromonospora craterilacus]
MTATAGCVASGSAEVKLDTLHQLHRAALFNYLVKLTLGDRQLAEDLLQETFLRAWRQLLRDDDTDIEIFRPWLFTVARRLVVDMLRARRVRPVEVMAEDLTRIHAADDRIDQLVGAHVVRDALGRLSAEHRVVLLELYFRGRLPAEVAAQLGVPLGTVKSRAFYAKQALRAYLDQ